MNKLWLLPLIAAVVSAQEGPLKKAEGQARLAAWDAKAKRVKRFEDLQRLKKDLRYISAELDREAIEAERPLEEYSVGGLARIRGLRQNGNLDEKLTPTLDQLAKIFSEFPKKEFARSYAGDLYDAVSRELGWIADEAEDEETLLALLETHLSVAEEAPGEGANAAGLFPENLTLKQFKALGPIKIFMVKHRTNRPKAHVATTDKEIVAGKHNVQIGVEVTGRVTYADLFFWDQDYTFNFNDLHCEITPEWRLSHKNFPKPKVGDVIKVKGWTYYDVFHKAEHEYDPKNPVVGADRVTLWEIHPVQDIEIISSAP